MPKYCFIVWEVLIFYYSLTAPIELVAWSWYK